MSDKIFSACWYLVTPEQGKGPWPSHPYTTTKLLVSVVESRRGRNRKQEIYIISPLVDFRVLLLDCVCAWLETCDKTGHINPHQGIVCASQMSPFLSGSQWVFPTACASPSVSIAPSSPGPQPRIPLDEGILQKATEEQRATRCCKGRVSDEYTVTYLTYPGNGFITWNKKIHD